MAYNTINNLSEKTPNNPIINNKNKGFKAFVLMILSVMKKQNKVKTKVPT